MSYFIKVYVFIDEARAYEWRDIGLRMLKSYLEKQLVQTAENVI